MILEYIIVTLVFTGLYFFINKYLPNKDNSITGTDEVDHFNKIQNIISNYDKTESPDQGLREKVAHLEHEIKDLKVQHAYATKTEVIEETTRSSSDYSSSYPIVRSGNEIFLKDKTQKILNFIICRMLTTNSTSIKIEDISESILGGEISKKILIELTQKDYLEKNIHIKNNNYRFETFVATDKLNKSLVPIKTAYSMLVENKESTKTRVQLIDYAEKSMSIPQKEFDRCRTSKDVFTKLIYSLEQQIIPIDSLAGQLNA